MRLQRHGKKGMPYYHIVIADGRAPRDGRFVEKIGTYNPLTKPATIEINFDKALNWLDKGVMPTDTVKAILSYKGVMYKYHLSKGIKKGALTPELAETKFQTWFQEKQTKIESKIKQKDIDKKSLLKKRLEAEANVNEKRTIALAKKQAKLIAKTEASVEASVEASAEVSVEASAEVNVEETETVILAEETTKQEETTTESEA